MKMEIIFTGGKKVEVHYKSFIFFTDQSIEYGGDGNAPDPYTMFLASLGACAGFYVLAFCQSRGISTQGINLVEYILPKSNGTKELEKIQIDICLPQDFPTKYISAIVHAADNCLVKKIIFASPKIEVKAVQN